MSATFTVDLISDLNLSDDEQFDWQGRATSLFCIVAGNISNNVVVIKRTLQHLASCYRGVMYIDGSADHSNLYDYEYRIEEIQTACDNITNVIYLHQHVVILNGVAFLAANGWYKNGAKLLDFNDKTLCDEYRIQDIGYLSRSLKSLQLHHDAKKIVMITSSPPNDNVLYNGPNIAPEIVEPAMSLVMDTENKVTHWLYGGCEIVTDEQTVGRRYVNNPRIAGQPYWPKCIEL